MAAVGPFAKYNIIVFSAMEREAGSMLEICIQEGCNSQGHLIKASRLFVVSFM